MPPAASSSLISVRSGGARTGPSYAHHMISYTVLTVSLKRESYRHRISLAGACLTMKILGRRSTGDRAVCVSDLHGSLEYHIVSSASIYMCFYPQSHFSNSCASHGLRSNVIAEANAVRQYDGKLQVLLGNCRDVICFYDVPFG